jgi:hypothetical protein
VKEPAGHRLIEVRNAVPALGIFSRVTVFALGLVEIHELANKKIKATIIVVVEPDGARGPAGSRNAGFFGYIGESAVSVVVIEDVAAILSDIDIGEAVAIVIADSDSLTIASTQYSGLLANVGECSVAVVAIKRVP